MQNQKLVQMEMFGGATSVADRVLEAHELPRPINCHALCVIILLHHPNKWIDILHVINKYKYHKFQTRLAEISRVYPELVSRRKKVIETRFGFKTDITEYKLNDYDYGFRLYMDVINKNGSMYKTMNGVNMLSSDTVE